MAGTARYSAKGTTGSGIAGSHTELHATEKFRNSAESQCRDWQTGSATHAIWANLTDGSGMKIFTKIGQTIYRPTNNKEATCQAEKDPKQ